VLVQDNAQAVAVAGADLATAVAFTWAMQGETLEFLGWVN
jgi:hypothetical protein